MNLGHLISKLDLSPHPEGGFYRETYRSPAKIDQINGFKGPRSCSTGIYYLLTSDTRSHLHRIKSDEVWHFYQGDPLKVVMLSPEGHYEEFILGSNLDRHQVFQAVVPAGYWFGAEVVEGGAYALVGCTVAPGFDFADFELAPKEEMLTRYPDHSELINQFCSL